LSVLGLHNAAEEVMVTDKPRRWSVRLAAVGARVDYNALPDTIWVIPEAVFHSQSLD